MIDEVNARRVSLLRLGGQELIDLPDRVIDLHVDKFLAELRSGAPGVPGDAIVPAGRLGIGLLAFRKRRIA